MTKTTNPPDIHGECLGINVVKREGISDLIEIYVEDDGTWYHKMSMSSAYLPELERLLKSSRGE